MKNEILVWDGRESGEWEVEVILNDEGDTEPAGVFATEEEALTKVDELCSQNPDLFFDEEAHEMVKEENEPVDYGKLIAHAANDDLAFGLITPEKAEELHKYAESRASDGGLEEAVAKVGAKAVKSPEIG